MSSRPADTDEFVGHVGDPAIHDATIVSVALDGGRLVVVTSDPDEIEVELAFTGVSELEHRQAVGMIVYSLSEMQTASGDRRFVFANWHEPEQSDASLSVIARDVEVRRIP